jgi:hypothetical protein
MRIITRQADLLDHSGHVRRGLGRDQARVLVSEINLLRGLNGWAPLDMAGRWRRPRRRGP